MPSKDRSIRVIKRARIQALRQQESAQDPVTKTQNQIKREMFTTITSWIEEQRKTKEEASRRIRF